MHPPGAPVDNSRRYDLYLSAASHGTIAPAPAASSSTHGLQGSVNAGALADDVFEGVCKRAHDAGRNASVFYAPRSIGESNSEVPDAILQTRGGGMALFLLTDAFLDSEQCGIELRCFLRLRMKEQYDEKAMLRLVCVGMTPDEFRQDVRAQELVSRLDGCHLHSITLGSLAEMKAQIVELVFKEWELSNVLGATREASVRDLFSLFPETDFPIAAIVLGVEGPRPRSMNEICHEALSSRKLGRPRDSDLLRDILTLGSGLNGDRKRAGLHAYICKWESSEYWEWGAIARSALLGHEHGSLCMPEPELPVAGDDAISRGPPMIAPQNPDGVILDYNDPSTCEGKLKRLLLGTNSSSVSQMCNLRPQPVDTFAGGSYSTSPSVSRLISVCGGGGIGKTCALRGLCVDKDVGRRFPDGIFFFTLGKEASSTDVIVSLAKIAKTLGKDGDANAIRGCVSVKAAVDFAAGALSGLQCLLLLDDLWSTESCAVGHLEDLKHLLDSCTSSRIVFSTRSREISRRAGRLSVSFESRDEETSKRILLSFAEFTDSVEAEVEAMSNEAVEALKYALNVCKGYPIALAVTGRLVRRYLARTSNKSMAWCLYKSYAENLPDNFALNPRADTGDYPGLVIALRQSLDAVSAAREASGKECKYSAAEMYRALSVVRKQSRAPMSMLCALWCVDADRAKDVAEEFENLSLLGIQYDDANVEHGNRPHSFNIKMHDLILDYCKQQVRAHNESSQKWHAILLRGYQPAQPWKISLQRLFLWQHLDALLRQWYPLTPPRPWWTAPNDGYLFKNLVRHLVESGEYKEGTGLLLDVRWVQAQLLENGIGQVVQDYECIIDFLRKARESHGRGESHTPLSAIEAIEGALRMAWPSISSHGHPEQLAFQMSGRLNSLQERSAGVSQFLQSINKYAPTPWLRPICTSSAQCLPPPNPALRMSSSVKGISSATLVPETDTIVATGDGLARVLRVSSGHTVYELAGDCGAVCCTAAYREYFVTVIVTGGQDGMLRFWKADNGDPTGKRIKASDGSVVAVAVSKDGLFLVSGSSKGEVRRWHTMTREAVGRMSIDTSKGLEQVNAVAVSTDGRCVAAGTSRGAVWRWDVGHGNVDDSPPAVLLGTHDYEVLALAITDDGDTVVSGGKGKTVQVWRRSDQASAGHPIRTGFSAHSLVFIGRTDIYCGLGDGCIHVYNTHSGSLLKQLPIAHSDSVLTLDVSTDAKRLLSGGGGQDGGLARVWDLTCKDGWATGGEGSAERWRSDRVKCIAASADGRWVVSGHDGSGVRLWDAASGEENSEPLLGVNSSPEFSVLCVAFSPDSRRIISGSEDGYVRIWDINSRRFAFRPLLAHNAGVTSVEVSPDGMLIISRSRGVKDEVRIWAMGTERLERVLDESDPIFCSSCDVLTTPGDSSTSTDSARLSMSRNEWSKLVYSGDPSNGIVVGSFDSDVTETGWYYDAGRRRLWAGLVGGGMAIVCMK